METLTSVPAITSYAALESGELAQATQEATEISSKILSIIFEYALNKFDDSMDRLGAGIPKFLTVIDQFVMAKKQVQMCLPAFPFKSANKQYKVLGILPDKAEEIALERLNTMCVRIGEVYAPGAKLVIISDGLVYNDLLSIPDRHVWAYGQAIRAMVLQKGFTQIDFSRIRDLIDFPLPEEKLDEIKYVANATNFRRSLLNRFGKENHDIDSEIQQKPDTLMTYRGYCRFLESDLQYIFPLQTGRTSNGYKRSVKFLAKEMLIRGFAFAGAVKAAFPDYLRLSIHQSTGEHKLSMALLNSKTGYTTPWHCSVALMNDGEWMSAPMGLYKNDATMEVVEEDGRPSYFKQKGGVNGDASN
ncbi:hypothetical protein ACHAQJ_009647 [Trichoderma viride]